VPGSRRTTRRDARASAVQCFDLLGAARRGRGRQAGFAVLIAFPSSWRPGNWLRDRWDRRRHSANR
jgi:hypothetical protein